MTAPRAAGPRVITWGARGAATVGGLGALVGLVVGLFAYPPTAVFAMFELGIPAAVVGLVGGVVAGAVARLLRAPRRHDAVGR